MKQPKGFTLIELLVVVAVIGILAAVALPAYSNYTIRGKIPDATSNLATKRVAMEQFFQDNRTYVGSNVAAGQPCNTDTDDSKYYTFSCTGAGTPSASTYIITATGTGTMTGFTYTIDQNNNKTSTIVAPASSNWIAPLTNCWITKPGGVC
jgi:type IV pilus assembly protein PilE